jgi:uncharacterized protein (TIGR03382 family)
MMHTLLRISVLVAAIHAALSVSSPGHARACSLIENEQQLTDPGEQVLDTTPPEAPALGEIEIYRRPESSGASGCQGAASSCDGSGGIGIPIGAPADDRTPASGIGYVVDIVGEGISDAEVPGYARLVDSNGHLWIHFHDRDQDIDITVAVRARDLGGNLSEPTLIDISSGGTGGCSAGARSGTASLALVILALAVALRRRRGVFAG